MGVFLEDTADWWVKDFEHTISEPQIQLSPIVIMHHNGFKGIWLREDDGQRC